MATCTNCDGMSSSAVLMEVIDLDNLVNYLMNLYLNSLFTITPGREIWNDYEDTNNDNTACGSDMSEWTCHNHGTCNTSISSEHKNQ